MEAQRSSQPGAWLIVGGKTRLARALFAAALASGREAFVVHAGADERTALLDLYPASALLEASQGIERPTLCIFVCALGLTHPERPDLPRHADRLHRDAALLLALVQSQAAGIHVLLVSTVIALAPPRDRCHYAGFKNLAESVVAAQLQGVEGAMLSVFYPGRLVDRPSAAGMSARLATPHEVLAQKMLRTAAGGRPAQCIVGIDARLWLFFHAARMLIQSVSPRLGAIQLHSRDGLPRS